MWWVLTIGFNINFLEPKRHRSRSCVCWLANVEWGLDSDQSGMRSLTVNGKLQARTRSCVTEPRLCCVTPRPTNHNAKRHVFARWLARMGGRWRRIIKPISARVSWCCCNDAASLFPATQKHNGRKLRVYLNCPFKISTQSLCLYIQELLSYVNCELLGSRKFALQVTLRAFSTFQSWWFITLM